jgi:hypothetical protein
MSPHGDKPVIFNSGVAIMTTYAGTREILDDVVR